MELPEDSHVYGKGVGTGGVAPERVDAEPLAGLRDALEAAQRGLGVRRSTRGQDEARHSAHRGDIRGVDRDGLVADGLGRGPLLEVVALGEHVRGGHPRALADLQYGAIVSYGDDYLGWRGGQEGRDPAYNLLLVQPRPLPNQVRGSRKRL